MLLSSRTGVEADVELCVQDRIGWMVKGVDELRIGDIIACPDNPDGDRPSHRRSISFCVLERIVLRAKQVIHSFCQ